MTLTVLVSVSLLALVVTARPVPPESEVYVVLEYTEEVEYVG